MKYVLLVLILLASGCRHSQVRETDNREMSGGKRFLRGIGAALQGMGEANMHGPDNKPVNCIGQTFGSTTHINCN